MALKIKQQNDVFMIEGSINTNTVKQFKNHLEFLLLYTKGVTINLDFVKHIDQYGIKAFNDLYKTACLKNKPFLISGQRSHEIYEAIKMNCAA